MKRLGLLLVLFTLSGTSSATADWRWAPPPPTKHKVTYSYDSLKSLKHTYLKERARYKRLVARYNKRRLREWNHWAHLYIPTCTWYGESGYGPQFAPVRYVTPNAQGSGAYGKYQFMSSTYHGVAKYHDWSPLDQEIAGHREYWKAGTSPWSNC
jgi:branched-subunit amino acid aminotransferase/4-amino-4-deoxychorismate lyase